MKILITGICGFVGSTLANWLRQCDPKIEIIGLDNFSRPGSETNRPGLRASGIAVRHGDVRNAADFETLPATDWVIDAAANPSVLAGVDGTTSTRQLIEHNLHGTLNTLEYCKRVRAGFILLSTSRVYSIRTLAALPLRVHHAAFELAAQPPLPRGVSPAGLTTEFSTAAPISLYGATKLASEILALEYAATFDLPVWINRCGILAGAGQFGTAEQGIFSYWLHAYVAHRPLKYVGFQGFGHQVRDAFHPADLAALVWKQLNYHGQTERRLFNVGGGRANALSLAQLTEWCRQRWGSHTVTADLRPRPFDVPWVVMDHTAVTAEFGWRPLKSLPTILGEIADHAERHPHWQELTGAA